MADEGIKAKVEGYFSEITTILPAIQEEQRAIDRATGSKLNIFERYLGPHEVLLSRIIRDLLDTNGPHGQGELFLRLFLKELEALDKLKGSQDIKIKGINISSPVEVVCEMPTHLIEAIRRRIDIVIDAAPNFVIGIENKPWASEQPDQIEAYHAHLSEKSKTVFLVYLSGNGSFPKTIKQEIWEACGYLLPYNAKSGPSLKRWLESCADASEAERVRWFLRDFASYVSSAFTVGITDCSQENING